MSGLIWKYIEPFLFIVCLVFLVLFFGRIISNGIDHNEYMKKFTKKCESSGGVVFVPRGVRGWPMPECRAPESIIDVNIDD